MSLSSDTARQQRATRISAIRLNTVGAVQLRSAPEQFFSTGSYEVGKTVALLEKPVLSCEVWVDEAGGISAAEITRLEAENPGSIHTEHENNELKHCWVKWNEIPAIRLAAGNERVYELDSFSGIITFGRSQNGKVPPQGDLNIRVRYSYGGGAAGNREIGGVDALLGSIPRINGVVNVTPMSGGTDRPDMDKVERLGNKRLRHRFVPVSREDFEEIVLEQFERAALVKCFPGIDEKGNRAPGHVCVVVMGRGMDGGCASHELCREIFAYLSKRADCNLTADGRLHVVPSTQMTINVEVHASFKDLDRAAVTQQQICENIAELINNVWRGRDIGDQIDLGEIFQTVKATPNVAAITRILPEGRYMSDGEYKLTALDGDSVFPFATVKSGVHIVRIV
jgi:predicted phage baseplate assembly protein